jgi:hypothetical protein
MARPLKTGLDYFPHDCDASSDEKIEAMRALYGNDGYAFFFILLERIYRTSDAALDLSSETTVKILAKKTGIRIDKFQKILRSSLELGLFSKEVFNNSKQLTSNAIRSRANNVLRQREYQRDYHTQNSELSSLKTLQETPQEKTLKTLQETGESKVNKSKVKEIKEKSSSISPSPKNVKDEEDDKVNSFFNFILQTFNENICPTTPIINKELKALLGKYPQEMVMNAIESAALHGGKTIEYVKKVLINETDMNPDFNNAQANKTLDPDLRRSGVRYIGGGDPRQRRK